MVLADSHGISRVPRYSGTYPASQEHFAYGVVTLYDQPFQTVRLCFWLVTRRLTAGRPYNPLVQARRFGLCPRSLAATSGITIVFSSCGY
jgi:hypothetical protein